MSHKAIVSGLLFLVLLAITAVYSNHFHNEFHFDDSHTIQDNAFIRDIKNIPLFFQDCTTSSSMPSHQGYRPLVTTTLAIDYALTPAEKRNPLDPFWFHVSNFSWLLLIVILLYFIQVKLYETAFPKGAELNSYFAVLGCAWYGLHTANAETVNYIISRSDILSTLAIIGSFALYVQFPNWRKTYVYLIPVILGMFAKETTIMFAPAMIAYDYMIEKQKSLVDLLTFKEISNFFKSIFGGLVPLVVCIALAIFTIKMTKHHEPGGTSVLWYASSQPYIIWHYVTQFFFPLELTADTDIPLVISYNGTIYSRLFGGIIFLVFLIGLAFYTSTKKEWRPFSFGLVWFLLMLLPTSSFIALAEVTNDHRVFLPYIGLIFSMVCLLINLTNKFFAAQGQAKYAVFALMIPVLGAYGYGTHQRNIVWQKDETLWKDVTEKSPNNGRGWMNYGLTLMGQGNYAGAETAFDSALVKTPRYYILHVNMAILKQAQGKLSEAEQFYQNAIAYGPNYVESYYYYSRYLGSQQRLDEAEEYCNKALAIFPGHIYSRYQIMEIYKQKADKAKLKQAAELTLQYYPNDSYAKQYLATANSAEPLTPITQQNSTTVLINKSLAYYQSGKYRECINTCYDVLAVEPNSATAYNNICSAYAMLQKYDSAEIACKKALEISPNYQQAKNNLKWAQDELKKQR